MNSERKSIAPRATGALPVGRRNTLYVVSIGTLATGVIWLVFQYFVRVVDQFGFENPHPQQRWWLIAHAVFSFVAVWMFGALWSDHIVRGWRAKLRRKSGGTMFGLGVWLTLTGCALYYVGSDFWRSLTSFAHWIPGVATLAVFLIHFRKKGRVSPPGPESSTDPGRDQKL